MHMICAARLTLYVPISVYVLEYGRWNYGDIANLPHDELESFNKYYEQYLRRLAKDGAANNGQGIVLICDWDGFSFSLLTSGKGETFRPPTCSTAKDFIHHVVPSNI